MYAEFSDQQPTCNNLVFKTTVHLFRVPPPARAFTCNIEQPAPANVGSVLGAHEHGADGTRPEEGDGRGRSHELGHAVPARRRRVRAFCPKLLPVAG